jgi:hypothetical protein
MFAIDQCHERTIFAGSVRSLKQNPLLRIHLGGFRRRDGEELRIEGIHIVVEEMCSA